MTILDDIEKAIEPLIPAEARPATNLAVSFIDSLGKLRTVDSIQLRAMATRERVAGASANKASHLAGLREAIERIMLQPQEVDVVDAIMTEVARRIP